MDSKMLPLGPGMRVGRVFEGFAPGEWFKGGIEQFRCAICVGGAVVPGARLVPGADLSALVGVSGQGSNSILNSWSLSGSYEPATGRLCATKRYTFFTQKEQDVARKQRARELKRAAAAIAAEEVKLRLDAAQMRENETAVAKQLEASRAMTLAAREHQVATEKELARVRAEAAQIEHLLAQKRSAQAQAQAQVQAQVHAQRCSPSAAQPATAIALTDGEALSLAPSPHSDVEIVLESDSGASAASSSSSSAGQAAAAATAPPRPAQKRTTRGVHFDPHSSAFDSDASGKYDSDEDFKPPSGHTLRPKPSACAVCNERYKWNRSGTMRKHGRPLCAGSHKTLAEHDRMRTDAGELARAGSAAQAEQQPEVPAQAEPGAEAAAKADPAADAGAEALPVMQVQELDGAALAAYAVSEELGGANAAPEAPTPQPADMLAEAATEARAEAQTDAEDAAGFSADDGGEADDPELDHWFDAQSSPTQPWTSADHAAASTDDDDENDDNEEVEEVVEGGDQGGSALEHESPVKRARVEGGGA